MKIQFKKIWEHSVAPTRATSGAAGFDLYAAEDATVFSQIVVKTGISVAIPYGYVGLIRPRSGLAVKCGVDVKAGVIDSDYRGELMVLLSIGRQFIPHQIKTGDRIAQLVVVPNLTDSEVVDVLSDTERGENGFGSTGMN